MFHDHGWVATALTWPLGRHSMFIDQGWAATITAVVRAAYPLVVRLTNLHVIEPC